jgi:hypothetical protein
MGNSEFAFMMEPPTLDELLHNENYNSVRDAANRLNERLEADARTSDGVFTASRTLIETVCKTLLDLLDIEYDNDADLADISKQLLKSLDLHPSTQTELSLKQMCQGAINMINGIGSIRNSHGDAHGTGQVAEQLPFHNAELSAYLTYAVTRYCIQAYEAKIARKRGADLTDDEEHQLVEVWLEVAKQHKITNPDQLPYSQCLEDIAARFTNTTKIVLPRRDIFFKLIRLRKTCKLPKPEISDNGQE